MLIYKIIRTEFRLHPPQSLKKVIFAEWIDVLAKSSTYNPSYGKTLNRVQTKLKATRSPLLANHLYYT